MINLKISKNETKNHIETEELYEYLKRNGHDVLENRNPDIGSKADLISSIELGAVLFASLYPVLKDLIGWANSKNYSVTITNENVSVTADNLTEKKFLELLSQIESKKTNIIISNDDE